MTRRRGSRPIEVLLVDDDPGDVRLTLETLKKSKVRNEVRVAQGGEAALERLRDRSQPRPDLVLLDLNMPSVDGHDVLAAMQDDPRLAGIPVVVLTTSDEESDIVESYDLKASAFVTKPLGLREFGQVVRAIEQFWFEIVRYPAPEDDPA